MVEGAVLGTRRPRVLLPKSRQAGAGQALKEAQEDPGSKVWVAPGSNPGTADWNSGLVERKGAADNTPREGSRGDCEGGQAPGGRRIRLG